MVVEKFAWILSLLLFIATPMQRCKAQARFQVLYDSTAWVRSLSEADLVALVPSQSGIHYVDCPNCNQGRQENQLEWSPSEPESIHCRYCQHHYPSPTFKENGFIAVRDPLGGEAKFPYWEDSNGYRHFFAAKRSDLIRRYLADQTLELARLHLATDDESAGRRAVLLLNRFAELFPAWCFHYDYPFQQKVIYSGAVSPENFRPGFRTARWTWWAYSDNPVPLIEAFSLLKDSEVLRQVSREMQRDIRHCVEHDLIRNAADQVLANEDLLTNMSPTAWRGLIRSGIAINDSKYVREPILRLKKLVETRYFYDGFWSEGSPDYGWQSLSGLKETLRLAALSKIGTGEPDFQREAWQSLAVAKQALSLMRLPDGRSVPVHDSWASSQRGPLHRSEPFILPALGHACLASGINEDQEQLHFTWSGGYGHSHSDNLSILLFSNGTESLSDIGYTHTAYRCWTTATASHNTVVIDGQNQVLGSVQAPSDGSLEIYDASDLNAQVVKARGERGYRGVADLYARTLIKMALDETESYYVDCFDVAGGNLHDYFLHGDADRDTQIQSELTLMPKPSLLEEPAKWMAPKNEGEMKQISEPYYAYGFLNNIHYASVDQSVIQFSILPSDGLLSKVRVTLFPEPNSEIYFGDSPSVRRANENDADLEKFRRTFAMLRHPSTAGRSKFLAVIEPYTDVPQLELECQRSQNGLVAITAKSKKRTDRIVLGERSKSIEIRIPGGGIASCDGEIGILSCSNPTGKIEYAKAIHGRWRIPGHQLTQCSLIENSCNLLLVDNMIEIDKTSAISPTVGSTICIRTRDGWGYPFTVASVDTIDDKLRVATIEPLRFQFDPSRKLLNLLSFPQRQHEGDVMVHWFSNSGE